MQTDIAKEYRAVFADIKSRFDQHPSRRDGLICKICPRFDTVFGRAKGKAHPMKVRLVR